MVSAMQINQFALMKPSLPSPFTALVLGVALLAAPAARAATYAETGDAGDLPATAQIITGVPGTSLDSVSGALTLSSGISDGDMFAIYIPNPSAFSATTTTFAPGINNFDTQIFLFNAQGLGVVANDDAASGGSQSTIPASSFNGLAGVYYLTIVGSGRYPVSNGGLIFPNYTDGTTDPTTIAGPTGLGGFLPITGYTGDSSEAGSYSIVLTGVQFSVVPEPSTLAVIVAGFTGLCVARRARLRFR